MKSVMEWLVADMTKSSRHTLLYMGVADT